MAKPQMTLSKRIFDLGVAILLLAVLWPLIVMVAVLIRVVDGRPVLFKSERMKTHDEGFAMWKFRTMKPDRNDSGVSGGDKDHRLTRSGRVLRKFRLDELPQLWNVIRGDISFVGPRPPLRHYVELFPALYAEVLRSRPGITGLATLVFHPTEERILEPCRTAEETEELYIRRCIPKKAQLDLVYQRNRSLCLDCRLMVATVFRDFTPGKTKGRTKSP